MTGVLISIAFGLAILGIWAIWSPHCRTDDGHDADRESGGGIEFGDF